MIAGKLECLLVSFYIQRPAGFQNERGAVLEIYRRHGKIFHVELLNIPVAPAIKDAVAIAKFAVRGAKYRRGLRMTHQPQRQVDHVYAEVHQRSTAAVLAPVKNPPRGNASTPVVDAAGKIDVPQFPVVDYLFKQLGFSPETHLKVDGQHLAVLPGGLDHLGRLGGVHGQWLFA